MPSPADIDQLPTVTAADAARRAGDTPSPELLAAVKAEGGRRRGRRHRRNGIIAGLAVALVAVPTVLNLAGDGESDRQSVTFADTPDNDDDGAVDDEPTPATTAGDPAPTVVDPAPGVSTAPTAPTLVCRSSINPACGAFSWSPQPSNAPLQLSIEASDTTVAIGETVTFTVSWSDDDATLVTDQFNSGEGASIGTPYSCVRAVRFGPWEPPAAAAGSGTLTFTHTYTEAGTFGASFHGGTALGTPVDCDDPYQSQGVTNIAITVTA